MDQDRSKFITPEGRIDTRAAMEAARKARATAFRDMATLLTAGGRRR